MTLASEVHEAYELRASRAGTAKVLLTCEHASNRLPQGWRWSAADARLADMHWAFDPGAAALAGELAEAMEAPLVLARFCRLLVDPNRAVDSYTLLRARCDGIPVELNVGVSAADLDRRLRGYYHPFHDAVDRAAEAVQPELVFSVHSFTPIYEGTARQVELGILHVDQPALAERWQEAGRRAGFDTRINEPYSGVDGSMYSAQIHGQRAGCPALELEVRQDIATDPGRRRAVLALVLELLGQRGER